MLFATQLYFLIRMLFPLVISYDSIKEQSTSAKLFTDEIKECITLQAQYIYDAFGIITNRFRWCRK
jgi:hypothetical protein